MSPFLPDDKDPLASRDPSSAQQASEGSARRVAPSAGRGILSTPAAVTHFDRPRAEGSVKLGLASIVGDSEVLRDAIERARKVATSRLTTVLLMGETGTGKELFARAVHYEGPARGETFVYISDSGENAIKIFRVQDNE